MDTTGATGKTSDRFEQVDAPLALPSQDSMEDQMGHIGLEVISPGPSNNSALSSSEGRLLPSGEFLGFIGLVNKSKSSLKRKREFIEEMTDKTLKDRVDLEDLGLQVLKFTLCSFAHLFMMNISNSAALHSGGSREYTARMYLQLWNNLFWSTANPDEVSSTAARRCITISSWRRAVDFFGTTLLIREYERFEEKSYAVAGPAGEFINDYNDLQDLHRDNKVQSELKGVRLLIIGETSTNFEVLSPCQDTTEEAVEIKEFDRKARMRRYIVPKERVRVNAPLRLQHSINTCSLLVTYECFGFNIKGNLEHAHFNKMRTN